MYYNTLELENAKIGGGGGFLLENRRRYNCYC